MLTIVTGLPGNGKTLYTLDFVVKYAEKENKALKEKGEEPRPIYQHNINGLKLPWETLEEARNWNDCPTGSIIVIDEAQNFFPPLANGSQRPSHYTDYATHRHRGLDIFLITQNATLIDFKIRTMCGRHIHLTRALGLEKATVYTFDAVQNTSNDKYKSVPGAFKKQWKYPKNVYDWYTSTEQNTYTADIPKLRLFGVAALILLCIGLLVKVLTTIFFTSDDTPAETVAATDLIPTLDILDNNTTTTESEPDFLTAADLIPTIPGIPISAPIYRNQFNVVSAPRVDGCGRFNFNNHTTCICNDQRGNFVDVPADFCSAFIDRGFFDFTLTDGQYEEGRQADSLQGAGSGSQNLLTLDP